MKNVLFLMLFLLIVGAIKVNSQVRIGGNGVPNGAAVLDLNATDATNNGTKGLALPRVSLANNTAQITSGTANLSGMLVYNTNTTLGAGVYYWDGSKWIKVSDGTFTEGDGVIGNELTNVVNGGGLTRYGAGTQNNPYTVGLDTSANSNSLIVKKSGGWVATNPFRTARMSVGARVGALPVGGYLDTTFTGFYQDRCWLIFEGLDSPNALLYAWNGRIRITRSSSQPITQLWVHAGCLDL